MVAEKQIALLEELCGFEPWFLYLLKVLLFARNFWLLKLLGGFKIKSEKRERWFWLVVFVMALKSMGAKNDNWLAA